MEVEGGKERLCLQLRAREECAPEALDASDSSDARAGEVFAFPPFICTALGPHSCQAGSGGRAGSWEPAWPGHMWGWGWEHSNGAHGPWLSTVQPPLQHNPRVHCSPLLVPITTWITTGHRGAASPAAAPRWDDNCPLCPPPLSSSS